MLGWFLLYRKWLSYTHIYILFFNIFSSILVYHRLLNTALHAIEKDLVVYPYHTQYLTIPYALPLATTSLFSTPARQLMFHRQVLICVIFFFWHGFGILVPRQGSNVGRLQWKLKSPCHWTPQGTPCVIFQIPYISYKVVVSLFLI